MKKVLFIAFSFLFALFAITAHGQVGPTGVIIQYNSGDPCQNPNVVKSFAAINISTATTTELVAAVAGKTVYLCSLTATVVGTSPTLQFKTGTKVSTACDTGAANQSGTYAIVSTSMITLAADSTTFLTGALSGELCLTSGGTAPSIQGNLTYIQQ